MTAYWLDETDGEGTDNGYDQFAGGYETQYGPRAFASNLWVNQYISMFTEPVRALGGEPPLVLVRGVGRAANGVSAGRATSGAPSRRWRRWCRKASMPR